MACKEDAGEEGEESVGLYKLWMPFIGQDGARDVWGIFFARRADYAHALGHEISLGELHGRWNDVSLVLTRDICWEVSVSPESLRDIRKIAPCGINPVECFLEQLACGCFECCVCAKCVAHYESAEQADCFT